MYDHSHPTTDDPLLPALRRAVTAIGLALVHDEMTDEAQALFMAWPFLQPERVDTWERMLDTSALGQHPALVDLEDIAAGVVRYDVAHVNAACQRAERWKDAALERLGGSGDTQAEARRQQHERSAIPAVRHTVPEVLSQDQHVAWYLRIGSRLMAAVHDIALACGDDDLASDVGTQLSHLYTTPGWWTEGSHLVVLTAEGRVSSQSARDLLAEVCAVLVPLHLGLADDADLRQGHIAAAQERVPHVLSAVRRWIETPDAPLNFSPSTQMLSQMQQDTQELAEHAGEGGKTAVKLARQSRDWGVRLVKVGEEKPFNAKKLLRIMQEGVDRTRSDQLEPPEALGAHLADRDMVERAVQGIGKLLHLDDAVVSQALADGTAEDLEVSAERIGQLSRTAMFTPQMLMGAAIVLLLVVLASGATWVFL